jgi:predicted Rossmann-fold nucleotide-binding protein
MPGGLGTLDELFEAATLIQCGKIGPFPLILMGEKFWDGMRQWAQHMMAEGVFARDEIGFGHVTDSPKEAVDLIIRGVHSSVRACLKPLACKKD